MGQMTQCDEGHYYDKSLNRNCPHCGLGTVAAKKAGARPVDDDDDETEQDKTVASPGAARPGRGARRDGDRNDDVTRAVWRGKLGIDPVVGWLVCHEGANQGRDYRICSGRNVIGRDPSSQICIRGDDSITLLNHATIFYDTRKVAFHVMVGDGRMGVYVNGDVVLQPTRLNAYDVVEIGATKLIFVPLCGEKFQWKEKPKSEGKPPANETRADPVDDDDDDNDDHDDDDNVTRAI